MGFIAAKFSFPKYVLINITLQFFPNLCKGLQSAYYLPLVMIFHGL
jgi:hypothetical protein